LHTQLVWIGRPAAPRLEDRLVAAAFQVAEAGALADPSSPFSAAWDEALRRAAARLSAHPPGSLVFAEDRQDLRLEWRSDGSRDVAASRSRGVSVRAGAGPRAYSIHRSDPDPEDAVALAGMLSGSRGSVVPRDDGGLRSAGFDPAGRLSARLVDWIEAARALCAGSLEDAAARWVAFRQDVRLARPGREPVEDSRRGSRGLLEVRVASRGRRASAVGERARRSQVEGEAQFARCVAERALRRLEARPAPAGETVAVFAAGVGGILVHELVGHALEGDTVLRGASALARSTGRIGPHELRVVDDPRRARAPWRLDDEGEPSGPTILVRDGEVVGLLHDFHTAERRGDRPTGHGRRATFADPIRPRMGCTYLGPGPLRPEEVLEGIGRGVYVRRMQSAGTDTRSGTAFFRVTDADLVIDGRIDAPLDGFLLMVDWGALRRLDRIAGDLEFDTCTGSCVREGQPLVTSVGAPTYRIGSATVISP
jgi:TldD protein